jgi:hypothetical protein
MRIILIGAALIFLWCTAWLWVPLLAIGTGAALIGGAVAVHQASSAPQPAPPEKAQNEPDAKPIAEATDATAYDSKQTAAAEAQRLSDEQSAVTASQQFTTAALTQSANPDQTPSSLPGRLNDTFRAMIQRTGKRCSAITDHVWITPDHVSIMCDRRFREAFIRESDGWRFGRPGE